uniref:Putative metalloprotease n=1 Tax=Ixodes ricinus TaxID=34613 RepID=A0A0K8RCZ2_IXORI
MDLADRFGGDIKKRSAVMGASEFQGFCSEWKRIAIVEDTPATYSMIQLLAHELAHTLGATHDGIAPPRTATGMLINACPDQGYMMAPSAHGRNSGHFSNCSIIQIREFIKTIQ